MPSNVVIAAMDSAKILHAMCETTPNKAVYLPLTTLLVQICVAGTPESRKKASSLMLHVVELTEGVVKDGVDLLLPPKVLEGLDKLERILAEILRHIESIPEQRNKLDTLNLSVGKLHLQSAYLRRKLDRAHRALTSASRLSSASRNECILEFATITTRAAGAICELPVLNLLKPVVGMVALICDTAKVVNSNRDAALELAKHAENVTNSVVGHATTKVGDEKSLLPLRRALEEIQQFLNVLKTRRWGVTSFALAGKDKERFATLNAALDRALEVLTSRQTIAILEIARANTNELAAVKAAMHLRGDEVKRRILQTLPQLPFHFAHVTLDRTLNGGMFFFLDTA
ncbi:hypothetical protein C8F04DRAFT_1089027, partial [Mycena alexandri]